MSNRAALALAFLVSLSALLLVCPAGAADFPGWRGARRDGVTDLRPKAWPAQLERVWSVPVGEGHSSPVVAGDRVFQFGRLGNDEVVTCLGLDGKQVWQQRYPIAYEMHSAATAHGKGPKSTPMVAGGRLVTFGIDGVVTCWDAARGERLWRREFRDRFPKTSPLYGAAASPLVAGGHVFLPIGGHDRGQVAAFELATGNPAWTWSEDGPGYGSPIIARFGGQSQLVMPMQRFFVAFTGNGRELWRLPYVTEYDQNSVTPLATDDLLIVSGYNRPIAAYRVSAADGKFAVDLAWENDQAALYMSSPVLVGDRVFGFSQRNSGQHLCLRRQSGELVWRGPPRQGDNALLLVAGDAVLSLTTKGRLIVFRAGDTYEELANYTVATTPTWAQPAPAGDSLYVKDADTLTRWRLPTQ